MFSSLRTLLCGFAVTAVAIMWDGKVNVEHNWPVLVLLALFNVVLFIGYQTLAGLTAILIYLRPILVGFLAWLMHGEALSPAKLVGLFSGFSEIVLR